ncbi:hypothetical protein [Calderihabitans maritimus]|nr:hypothetical protein [Calderihabitans maritimus]
MVSGHVEKGRHNTTKPKKPGLVIAYMQARVSAKRAKLVLERQREKIKRIPIGELPPIYDLMVCGGRSEGV